MPYITKDKRDQVDPAITTLQETLFGMKLSPDDLKGVLNYTFTRIILGAFQLRSNPKYWKFNDALGLLDAVGRELYRRYAAPYEDAKIAENGDV